MEAYWYWLCHELYLERTWARELLKSFGSVQAVFEADEGEIGKRFPGTSGRRLEMLRKRRGWDLYGEYEKCLEKGIWFLNCDDNRFPSGLRTIPDGPLGIFGKGKIPEGSKPAIAVVGARMCSDYGKMTAQVFGRGLARQQVQVVSGMAAGVDGYAHRGALEEQGSSIAVLGCGVDICYPRQNRDLYEDLQERGALISEYPPGTAPFPYLFPMRNRIISGLSQAVIVVEAKEKSGSLITADAALEQGKEVYAVPGRIGEPLSDGCNWLIAQGAGIAVSPEYVCKELGIFSKKVGGDLKINKNLLESTEDMVYSCLSLQSQHIEEIRKKTGLPLLEVMKILVSLELKGWVCETQKSYYSKKDSG